MKKKTKKCSECGRICSWDEKWQQYYHAYQFGELLGGKGMCKISTFPENPKSNAEALIHEKSLSDARLKQANAAWEEVGI